MGSFRDQIHTTTMRVSPKSERKRYQKALPLVLFAVTILYIFQEDRRLLFPFFDGFPDADEMPKPAISSSETIQSDVQEVRKRNAVMETGHANHPIEPSYKSYRLPIPGSPDFNENDPTIVVQLGGNTFNNIAHVARGLGLSLLLQREYKVNSTIVLKRQKAGVAKEAERDVKQCFPYMRQFDFGAGMTPAVEASIADQKNDSVLKDIDHVINMHNNRTLPLMAKQIPKFLDLFGQQRQSLGPENGSVNLPFLYAWRLTCSGPLMDKYYDDFRKIFHFDEGNDCCAATPDPDESVFVSE